MLRAAAGRRRLTQFLGEVRSAGVIIAADHAAALMPSHLHELVHFELVRQARGRFVPQIVEVQIDHRLVGGIDLLQQQLRERNVITGFESSDLIVIAGRPAMGKTALATNVTQHVAFKQRLTVLVIPLEMRADGG